MLLAVCASINRKSRLAPTSMHATWTIRPHEQTDESCIGASSSSDSASFVDPADFGVSVFLAAFADPADFGVPSRFLLAGVSRASSLSSTATFLQIICPVTGMKLYVLKGGTLMTVIGAT